MNRVGHLHTPQALDALDKNDIAEVCAELVGTVIEAICILFNMWTPGASFPSLLRGDYKTR